MPYLAVVIAITAIAYPLMVLNPFHTQGNRELTAALALLRWASWITGLCVLVASAGLLFQKWPRPVRKSAWALRIVRIAVSAVCVLGCVAALVFSRVNFLETMFHPVGTPAFVPADQAKVDASDMVLAVSAGPIAHAYPVRAMAYHHIVNDYVGDTPVAATY